uniref:hypothetical protein n=1 Tax=Achromobacter sp. GbtcB20 TaxID=2824765 RepID=UPI001C30B7AA
GLHYLSFETVCFAYVSRANAVLLSTVRCHIARTGQARGGGVDGPTMTENHTGAAAMLPARHGACLRLIGRAGLK